MKIKVKLTLFYTISSIVLILFFSFLIYYGMSFLLFNEIDKNLSITADHLLSQNQPNFSIFTSLEKSLKDLQANSEIGVNVLDPAGTLLYKSKITKDQIINIPTLGSQKKIQFLNYKIETINENVRVSDPKVQHRYYRILVKKFFYKDIFLGWIQIFQPIDKVYFSLNILKKIILMGAPIVIIFISLVGYYLAHKSLAPIHSIADAAVKISHNNLSERIFQPNSSDELSGLIGVLNDSFDKLEKSFLTQKQFISDAAHELKTPLAILRTNIEAEINNSNLPLDLKQKLSQNIETLSRLSTLVEKLLFLSKLENKKIILNKTDVNLSGLLDNLKEDIQFLTENKNQNFVVELQNDVTIKGDFDLLYQAFFNFLNNAVKYTPESGKIFLSLKTINNSAVIVIQDTGIGIKKEELPNIFNRFYRSDKSRSLEKGYGLGLSIAKWIITLHQGSLEVDSEPKLGTRIQISLPLLA